jgi:hypothetical protein
MGRLIRRPAPILDPQAICLRVCRASIFRLECADEVPRAYTPRLQAAAEAQ